MLHDFPFTVDIIELRNDLKLRTSWETTLLQVEKFILPLAICVSEKVFISITAYLALGMLWL